MLPEFLDFIKDSCLCSYNAGFDLGFLNSELGIIGRRPLQEVIVIDILRMARRLLPGLQRYALWFVAEKLGVQSRQEHRAFSDVQLTLEVFRWLKGNLQGKGVVEFSIFSHLFSINNQKVNAVINQRLAEIQEAINLGLKLKIQYLSGINGKVSQRQVLPKEIKQERNQFYLVAFCFLRNEERTFRVESILRLEVVA